MMKCYEYARESTKQQNVRHQHGMNSIDGQPPKNKNAAGVESIQ